MELQVFSAGAVPGINSAAFSGGVSQHSGSVRQDSLVYPQQLTQLITQARPLYRPLKWRGILGTQNVESWASQIEDRKWQTLVEDPVNLTNKSPTQELPMPALTTSNQFLKIFEFGLAYGVTDRDVELAAKLGIGLTTENVEACNMAFEQFLEKVASVGHTPTGMKGLGNLADTTAVTAGTKTGGGTTWTGAATVTELVLDMHSLCNQVQTSSKENAEANLIVLPLAQYQQLFIKFTSPLETTAYELFSKQRPGVTIKVWDKLSNQGAGSTPCAMAWDTRDQYGPRMLMQREAEYGTPLRGTNGWLTPGKIATGGVRCINPAAVAKMSGL